MTIATGSTWDIKNQSSRRRGQRFPSFQNMSRSSHRLTILRGAPPLARARGVPRLPRFACAALRFAPSFPRPLRFVPRMGDPPPIALATPRLRQEAFGMYVHTPPPDLRAKASAKLKEEASMNTDAAAVSECCSFDRLLLQLSLFWQERYAYRWP